MNLINVDKNGKDTPVRVYKDEKGKYTIPISKKIGEEYKNKYFPVEFLKDVELDNGTEIIIKHAFMTWFDWEYFDKTGTKFVIKITAFEKVENNQEKHEEVTPQNIIENWSAGKDIQLEPDDLPFY